VRDGHDLNVVEAFAEDDGVWEPIKKCAASSVQIRRANHRSDLQASIGTAEFFVEPEGGVWPLIQ
jgi:hypothetical protein